MSQQLLAETNPLRRADYFNHLWMKLGVGWMEGELQQSCLFADESPFPDPPGPSQCVMVIHFHSFIGWLGLYVYMMSAVMEASANFQLKVGLAPCIGFLPLLCFHCDHCYSNRLRNHHIREVTCSAKGKKKKGLQSLRWSPWMVKCGIGTTNYRVRTSPECICYKF
jgi:hypothetical protein